MQLELTPPLCHEVITALHTQKNRIWVRLHRTERQIIQLTPDTDPSHRLYLETLKELRLDRIRKIEGLITLFEADEKCNR